MKRISFSIFLFLGLLLCIASSVQAQVTIGSGAEPNPGALLDLKQDGTTTKGLGMPRLRLTDKSNLYPMFELTVGSGTPNGQYESALKAGVDATHTGLMVYNIDQCTLLGKGLYVWDGTQWLVLGEEAVTLEGMVKKLGTAQDAIATNGAAWHKDQSGNIFLSGDFGTTAGRWMITNLAATAFVPEGSRTGEDPLVPQTLAVNTSFAKDSKNPLWVYPNETGTTSNTSTLYTNNPRLGLLYNWAAATNSKGGITNGLDDIDDAEDSATPQSVRVQGICPNGWHLPSDAEYTALESEISTNALLYSSISVNGSSIEEGEMDDRGTIHGKAMKDVCPTPGSIPPNASNGASNGVTSISPAKPGFMVWLVGNASPEMGSFISNIGNRGTFWSSSSTDEKAWSRFVSKAIDTVFRNDDYRFNMYSVRCKKN